MTCLSESTIAGFLERRLSSEQRERVDVHVDHCVACRHVVIDLLSELRLSSTTADEHTTHPARLGSDDRLAKGAVVGRFVVLETLGAGGMGVVYAAYDPELDRKVALKLLRRRAHVSDTHAHLVTEAQAMARINHPNVVAVYDVGTHREQVFAAMELVEGTTLRGWMTGQRRTWQEVARVFILAGEGLAAAHAANVVHGDFKPENVLLGRDGRAKVSDFGLATTPALLGAHVAGTPGYLAVEGYEPGGIDERSDQFSFCVALYEALHGSRPFSAQALDAFTEEVRRGPAIESAHREVPAPLHRVVCRGLALGPDDRYPSMHELLVDLRRATSVRRRRSIVPAAAILLACAIGGVIAADRGQAAGPKPCRDAASQLAGAWDGERRERVRVAFLRAVTPAAAASFERAAAVIDSYAAAWAATWTDACEATEVRGEQSTALLDLRQTCLVRARIQLRALTDLLVDGDAGALRGAATAAAALPPLAACSDVDALRAIVSPPLGAAMRMEIPSSADAPDKASATLPAALVDDGGRATRPDFKLPFGCGEAWRITRRARHSQADRHIDFTLPDNEPAGGLAVFASAPGWVSRIVPENGQVEIDHGGGWSTTYEHMTDINVSVRHYIGRGHVIGKVGNVNIENPLGQPGPAHLHYEQRYHQEVIAAAADERRGGSVHPYLEGELLDLAVTGPQLRTSTNNCFGGGAPASAAQYEVPVSNDVFSRTRATMEILTRRAGDHALFERWYNGQWNGTPMPHTIIGRPAVAVFKGELHVIARRSDGAIFDHHYGPFTGWRTTVLDGRAAGDPDVAVHGWTNSLRVAARGPDGLLYQWWTAANGAWTRAVRVGNIEVAGTPALFSHYDTLYIVARGTDHALRSWEADRAGQWTEWQLPGAAHDDPDIGVDPASGLVNVLARGSDNRLYRWESRDPDRAASDPRDGWSHPELVDAGLLVAGAPAMTIYRGALHAVVRAPNNAIHLCRKATRWSCEAIAGEYLDPPSIVQFDDQLQTVGRGANGNLHTVWYDPISGVWTPEDHHVRVAGAR